MEPVNEDKKERQARDVPEKLFLRTGEEVEKLGLP